MRLMRVLGIETSGTRGGIALVEDGRIRGTQLFEKGMFHGREIAPQIRSLLDETGTAPAGLDLLACDIGPGSYTGLRVGLAAAKGLCFALGKPIVGVASLDAMAEAARERARTLAPAIDAKWGHVYGAIYEEGLRVGPYLAEPPARFAARVPKGAFVFGDALETYGEIFRDAARGPRDLWDPRAEVIATLGERLYREGTRHDPATLVPLYLRPTSAELNSGGK